MFAQFPGNIPHRLVGTVFGFDDLQFQYDDENIKPGKKNATYNVMAAVRQEKRNKS